MSFGAFGRRLKRAGLSVKAYHLLVGEEAPTMVEYGLLISLIALVVAIAAAFIGTQVSSFFVTVGNSF